MRHNKGFRKLGRQRSHYRALMRNLTFALLEQERIETTLAKAKEVRGFAEKIITLGKRGSLHDRRRAMALMGNKIVHKKSGKKEDVVGKAFGDLAERYKNRTGGYTRIMKLGYARPGDAAPMVILELVDRPEKKPSPEEGTKSKKAKSTEENEEKSATA